MHYFVWINAGFVLIFVASQLETYGDLGATPDQRLPFYFMGLLFLSGALFCFFKGYRGASAAFPWNQDKKQDTEKPEPAKPIPARKRDKKVEAEETFDVDAAFARYMDNRPSEPVGTVEHAKKSGEGPNPRPVFGRKNA